MLGNYIIIKRNGTPIAAVKSITVNIKVPQIEISSPTSGQWREYIAGRKDWSVTTDYIVISQDWKSELLSVGSTYELVILDDNGVVIQGNALCIASSQTSAVGSIVRGNFSFIGTGALS